MGPRTMWRKGRHGGHGSWHRRHRLRDWKETEGEMPRMHCCWCRSSWLDTCRTGELEAWTEVRCSLGGWGEELHDQVPGQPMAGGQGHHPAGGEGDPVVGEREGVQPRTLGSV